MIGLWLRTRFFLLASAAPQFQLGGLCGLSTRYVRRGVRIVPLTAAMILLSVLTAPALARHPLEQYPDGAGLFDCTADNVNTVLVLPDGERWQCLYDPDFDDYFWEPRVSPTTPTDGVAWRNSTWTAADGITERTTSRVEWVKGVLYTGTDTFIRQPSTSPLTMPSGWIGVYSKLYVHDGTKWTSCRDSGWNYSSVASPHLVHTFNWGTAPCGAQWYTSLSWAAHWNSSSSSWMVSQQIDPTQPGGHYTGATAVNGRVFDPRPGDDSSPPKPPKHGPKKIKPPKPARAP
jgi:hypothetical protein